MRQIALGNVRERNESKRGSAPSSVAHFPPRRIRGGRKGFVNNFQMSFRYLCPCRCR